MEKRGHFPVKHLTGGRISYLCPLAWHSETKPSFMVWVNSEYENFYCFGCFPGDMEVLLPDFTLCKITELVKGQKVIGHDGKEGTVVRKLIRPFFGEMVYLKVKKVFYETVSTSDHNIYILPYLKKTLRRPSFSGKKYGHNIYKYGNVTKKKANEIRIGDCLCVPISKNIKKIPKLNMDVWTEKYRNSKGPVQKSFRSVSLNDDLLYLFGMYIAEGSASGRALRFSLHAKETKIAERIKKTLKSVFSLDSRYFVPKGRKNSLEITCCTSLLSRVFKEWFGGSSDTKHLPAHLFLLSNDQIKHIVDGYFDGDGHMGSSQKKTCATVSKQWSFQLFDILNRLKLYPSITMNVRKKRKIVYTVSWYNVQKPRPGRVGQYKEGYYCVPVIKKKTQQRTTTVYNLTVTPQNSYVVNSFVVGNCQAKHNIIHLVSFFENISARKAIDKLSDGMDFSIVDDEKLYNTELLTKFETIGIDHNPRTKEHDGVIELSKYLVDISNICNAFLDSVNYDKIECNRIDKLWALVDKSLQDFDFEKIEKIRSEIRELILNHKDALRQKEIQKLQNQYGEKNE